LGDSFIVEETNKVRSVIFRLLAGIIGAGIAVLAIPASKHSGGSFWPEWLHVLSFFVIGIVFLIYALTGRAWPRSYGQKISGKNEDLNDR
jgi:amino acid permease